MSALIFKNMKKYLIASILFLLIVKISKSQVSLSPWLGFNITNMSYQNVANEYNNIYLGNTEYTFSFGSNINIPIAMQKSLLIGFGISYINNNVRFALPANVEGIDQMQSIMKWKHSYSQVGFPIYISKAFYFDKDKKNNLSINLGLSLGINFESSSSFSGEVAKSEMDNDLVLFNVGTYFNEKAIFMPSFIGGFDIAPFKSFSNLKFGISTSINLLANPEFTSYGSFENRTKNIIQKGAISAKPQFYNVIFSLKYDIKFKKRNQEKLPKFKGEDIDY